ncbi:MAG: hypothetical protein RR434_05160, partial [Raoultibacter sp.]
ELPQKTYHPFGGNYKKSSSISCDFASFAEKLRSEGKNSMGGALLHIPKFQTQRNTSDRAQGVRPSLPR